MRLEAVLFDLDGTLVDTAKDFHWTINTLLAEENEASISFSQVRTVVSQGARAIVSNAFDIEPTHPECDRLTQRLLDIYAEHLAVDSQLFAGLSELLQWLDSSNVKWGIVTNKPERFTSPLMQGLELDKRSAATICPEHVQQPKPAPDALLLACNQMQTKPENCVYIGDHIRDIEAGRNAGMRTIAAEYGYIMNGEQVADWRANYTVLSSQDILPLLKSVYS